MSSIDVAALIEQIRSFLADAPNGKPHEGYRYGELLSQAAAALERLSAENARLGDVSDELRDELLAVRSNKSYFEKRAERAEAENAEYRDGEYGVNKLAERVAAAEIRYEHAEAENAKLHEANESFCRRQDWWNKKMFDTEQRAERAEALAALRLKWYATAKRMCADAEAERDTAISARESIEQFSHAKSDEIADLIAELDQYRRDALRWHRAGEES